MDTTKDVWSSNKMKTEQELLARRQEIMMLLIDNKNNTIRIHSHKRRMLLKEYNVLHWVLFE